MSGFLLQWPTLITLIMFPILVTVYVRLARREEAEVQAALGHVWDEYAARTPAFVPRLHRPPADGLGSEPEYAHKITKGGHALRPSYS